MSQTHKVQSLLPQILRTQALLVLFNFDAVI